MKQSKETTPLWVWLTFGLTSLVIAAYAAVQDEIFAVPDLRTITEAARAIILGGRRPLAARVNLVIRSARLGISRTARQPPSQDLILDLVQPSGLRQRQLALPQQQGIVFLPQRFPIHHRRPFLSDTRCAQEARSGGRLPQGTNLVKGRPGQGITTHPGLLFLASRWPLGRRPVRAT